MSYPSILPAVEILRVFSEEVGLLGGTVSDSFIDGAYVLARSVTPPEEEVAAGDRVQGGVALMASATEIRVHPYVLRQVCRNGAIRAHAIETMRIDLAEAAYEWEVSDSVRKAIRACGRPAVLVEGATEMRSAMERAADMALMLMPLMSMYQGKQRAMLLESIMENFENEKDRSAFGLMNAITATARETRDPQMRWTLEELGGGVPVAMVRPRPVMSGGVVRLREAVGAL